MSHRTSGSPQYPNRSSQPPTRLDAIPGSDAPQPLSLRPPYRLGRNYIRCGLRLRQDLWRALQAAARRQRRWVSDLSEELLRAGLGQRRSEAHPATAEGTTPLPEVQPGGGRHWVRLALEEPVWERLQAEATATGYTVSQLARQRFGMAVLGESPIGREGP